MQKDAPIPGKPFQISTQDQKRIVEVSVGLAKTFDDLVCLGLEKAGCPNLPPFEVPTWVRSCFDKYWSVSCAKVPSIAGKDEIPLRHQGHYAGLIRWSLHWMNGMVDRLDAIADKLPPLYLSAKTEKQIAEAWGRTPRFASVLTQEEWDDIEGLMTSPNPSPIQLIPEAFELPLAASAQLLHGLGDGQLGPSGTKDGSIKSSDATPIYMCLMLYWREIFRIQSIQELYNWLVVPFGKNRLGSDRKRLEKLCERIGLRFRGRGRPRKNPT
jgi:hypothetical protein